MKFTHAQNGVKKIFTAEILNLIAQISLVPLLIISILGIDGEELSSALEEKAPKYLIIILVLILAALVTFVVANIISIIGVVKASKDEPSFRIALLGIVTVIVSAAAATFLSNYDTASAVCTTVSQIASLGVTFFIMRGIRNLAIRLEDDEMEIRGDNFFKLFFILILVTAVMRFVSKVFTNEVGTVLSIIMTVLAGILTIIQYILYLSYLSKSRKMLEKEVPEQPVD